MRSNEALGEDIGRRVEGWIDRGFAPEMEGLKLAGTGYVALKGSVDIMPGVHELTGQFMADWLGFPDDERERLALILGAELQVDLLGRKLSEEEQLLALAGFRGLWHRTQRLVDNTSPGEESYTARALQHQDPDQVKGAVANLMVAGARTTAESISNAMRYVAEHPDVWDAAVRNPEQMHNLAAELLRLEGGIFNWGRVVVEPTELGGIELEPGTPVMGMIGSSNRDPRHFGKTPDQDPRKVILDRKQRNTTVFGSGVRPPRGTPPNPAYRFNSHFCVGAGMAQTFVTRVFSQLAQQELRLVLPQPNPPMKPNVIFLEHEELPLAVESMRPHLYPV
jgi:cytochrome P450